MSRISKLERAESVLKELNKDFLTHEEGAKLIQAFAEKVRSVKEEFKRTLETKSVDYQRKYDSLSALLREKTSEVDSKADAKETREYLTALRKEMKALLTEIREDIPEEPDLSKIELELARLRNEMPTQVNDQLIWQELNTLSETVEAAKKEMAELRTSHTASNRVLSARGFQLFINSQKKGQVNSVNFIPGTNVTISHDTSQGRNDVTINASGGGAGSTAWGDITGTLANQTDLQTALDAKQNDITLTTTGTSGAATFDGTTLNIPQYSGGSGGTVDTIVAGTGITVDATDPANPIVATTITQYTDEAAQDAVGGILTDSAEIDFTYTDATPSITASIVAASIDETKLDASVNASLDLADSAVQPAALADYIPLTQKGAASGVATLDGSSKIPTAQLPGLALTDVFTVASEAAQLALTAQEGDIAIRSDQNKTYAHNGGTAGTMADWSELLSPTAGVTSVNGQTGAVTLDTSDIAESGNLYFTNTRADDRIVAAVGTSIQAYSANLDEYAAVNPTAAGLALLDDADAAAQRTTLGLGTAATAATGDFATTAQGALADTALQPGAIGVSVQAYDADLTTWAGKTAPTGDVIGTTDSQTLTNKTIQVGSGNLRITENTGTPTQYLALSVGEELTASRTLNITTGDANRTLALDADITASTLATLTGAQTITSKRNQPRTSSQASSATLSPDLSTASVYYQTAQAADLTINDVAGAPVIGEVLAIYVTASGATRTITLGAGYTRLDSTSLAIPDGKTALIIGQYNGSAMMTTVTVQP